MLTTAFDRFLDLLVYSTWMRADHLCSHNRLHAEEP